ncbi:MAG TPA: hypothetical protein V6D09_21895 [Leptolyngbyaceae cyanobacterium]
MSNTNSNLKLRLTQSLDSFFALGFAITPLPGNKAHGRENLQHDLAIAQNMPLQRSAI